MSIAVYDMVTVEPGERAGTWQVHMQDDEDAVVLPGFTYEGDANDVAHDLRGILHRLVQRARTP